MSTRRFFAYYRNIEKLRAEESLLLLRIFAEPYIDHEKHDDKFIENLQRAAGIEPRKDSLTTEADAMSWGIKIVKKPAGGGESGAV